MGGCRWAVFPGDFVEAHRWGSPQAGTRGELMDCLISRLDGPEPGLAGLAGRQGGASGGWILIGVCAAYITSEKDPPRTRSYPLLDFLFRVPICIPVPGGHGAVSAAAVPSSRRRTASSPEASASACMVMPAAFPGGSYGGLDLASRCLERALWRHESSEGMGAGEEASILGLSKVRFSSRTGNVGGSQQDCG